MCIFTEKESKCNVKVVDFDGDGVIIDTDSLKNEVIRIWDVCIRYDRVGERIPIWLWSFRRLQNHVGNTIRHMLRIGAKDMQYRGLAVKR